MLPLNLPELGVDYYAFTGHKWWCGPEGVGGLYLKSEAMADLQTTFCSWRSLPPDWPDSKSWPDARRFEIATSAWPLLAALSQTIRLHNSWGNAETRYQRILSLAFYLRQRLADLEERTPLVCRQTREPETGILTFSIGAPPASLVAFLEDQQMLVREIPGSHGGVRACVHYLSVPEEIDRLCEGIRLYFNQH
jgi:L-cysteine/cystine lyase